MSEEYKPINNLWKDSEGYRYFGTLKLSSKIKYNGDDFIQLWEWVKQLQQERNQFKEYTNHNYDKAEQLQQENQQLKELLNTILNFEFFKNECPLNFGFENNTNENRAQNVFYEDKYCENTCNDDCKKCWLKYFERLKELEQGVSDVED